MLNNNNLLRFRIKESYDDGVITDVHCCITITFWTPSAKTNQKKEILIKRILWKSSTGICYAKSLFVDSVTV
jgi:hypothetical protein